MEYINLNYAATSAKKPEQSINAMTAYLNRNQFASPGRGGEGALSESRILIDARLALCRLLNVRRPEEIIFTSNATTALNMAINGLAKKDCHILSTAMEHNAVARPLTLLAESSGCQIDFIPVSKDGQIDFSLLESAIKPNTRFMVMTHSSNVTGAVLDYEKAAEIAKKHHLYFILDAAQTAGYLNIDFQNSNIDILVFTGHKSLMGPSGTGGFAVKKEIVSEISPFVTGGTGSASHLLTQPDFLPDKFESGTPNMLGLIGLKESVAFILEKGIENIRNEEDKLVQAFLDGIEGLPLDICSPRKAPRTPVVSIRPHTMDSSYLSSLLFEKYNIITRPGLHCSPLCHKTIGTYPEGTLRFSFGYFTTAHEIDSAVQALKDILLNFRG